MINVERLAGVLGQKDFGGVEFALSFDVGQLLAPVLRPVKADSLGDVQASVEQHQEDGLVAQTAADCRAF
jgi:hypothetical protein